jgi:hypothetical protein
MNQVQSEKHNGNCEERRREREKETFNEYAPNYTIEKEFFNQNIKFFCVNINF